jgi:hypothetical protein
VLPKLLHCANRKLLRYPPVDHVEYEQGESLRVLPSPFSRIAHSAKLEDQVATAPRSVFVDPQCRSGQYSVTFWQHN